MTDLDEDFAGPDLDRSVWLPHYLPAWSSLAQSAARYELRDSALRLTIPPDQGLWCADDHQPPTRVSGIQSGNWSGPVGGTRGQQPYRDGVLVREQQEPFWGATPSGGRLEIRFRATITPRSMVACWLVGLEVEPEQCAEICVTEIFGRTVVPGESAAVGMGLHRFRDPAVAEDFQAVRLPIDVASFHTYGLDWTAERAVFLVDGEPVRECAAPPTYPMQIEIAVFDFPEWSDGHDADSVPVLEVDAVKVITG